MHRAKEIPEVPPNMREIDNRLSVLLLKSIKEKMKARVLEESEGDMAVEISSIYILDTVWEDVAPG
eukprot:11787008-Prorocentrum_lima.AAC.1